MKYYVFKKMYGFFPSTYRDGCMESLTAVVLYCVGVVSGRCLWNDAFLLSRSARSVLPAVDVTLPSRRVRTIPVLYYRYSITTFRQLFD